MTTISIGKYLIHRLKEVGVETIFGVPGDYNMPLLDQIEDDKDVFWGNNANELNASYAADGYARINGVGALVTTFGVGELSAMAGIAGSYSEMVPVIHIVGMPNTKSQATGAVLHHTLGNGDYHVFQKMFAEITVANALLKQENAAEQIDRVLQHCIANVRPGYIGIPIDLINAEITVKASPIPSLSLDIPKNPEKTHRAALEDIIAKVEEAKKPIILVDACALRRNMIKDVQKLIEVSGFPTFTTPMGKGGVDEDQPAYRGCYAGDVSYDEVKQEVHDSDLILAIGCLKADFNTGGFTYHLDSDKVIEFHSFNVSVHYATYEKVSMNQLIPDLIKHFPKKRSIDFGPRPCGPQADSNSEVIDHTYFWTNIPRFLEPRSIIVAETGTSMFGAINMKAPKDAIFITQFLWGSIGYSVGSAMGAAMAGRTQDRRVYLFVGDGSFQLTAQEVSVMLHQGLTPVIIILNNDGYTIEKLIHGPDRKYNNFQMWQYSKTLEYFGCNLEHNLKESFQAKVGAQAKVTTRKELEKVLEQTRAEKNKIHILEVCMPQLDAPRELLLQVKTSENR
ncbi:hypothetical protein K450DRAFT_240677 [Umbelopsis ramanniana AG]|uniref:Pyruvate decarboxylase n=1 Tax=Umbelopsis ramanniana AG TaxID=1314678 RepID=A0AAD5EAK3_UMBRA|nr:uncharacterized protein K450DRAFT_240677 [Umbelopsis ramanniana AG]KAI8579862.1 hypothetical protein K450DRAFT_240677 [Umbelopsis ramanniana AG]